MCEILITEYICRHTHTHPHNLALIFADTQTTHQTSVSSLEWQPTYVVQPVGCLMPLCLHSTDWVSDYLCVCVSVVLLVSGYRDRAMCRNGPLHFLAGRPDLSGSAFITTWNLNVKQPPHYSHLSFSVGQSAWTLALQHKHAHLLLFVHAQIYSAGRKWHLLAQI